MKSPEFEILQAKRKKLPTDKQILIEKFPDLQVELEPTRPNIPFELGSEQGILTEAIHKQDHHERLQREKDLEESS